MHHQASRERKALKLNQRIIGLVLALGLAVGAYADTLNVMQIGDSITWGFNGTTATSGWRGGLETNLAGLGSPNTFNFIGLKGDGNASTVAGEKGGDGQTDDNFGPLHEGHSGWVIDALGLASSSKSYSDPSGTNTDPDSVFFGSGGASSGIANHLRTSTNTGGTIDPGNLNGHYSAPADVVMLAIGTNDVVGFTGFSGSPYNSVSEMIPVLRNLIDSIIGALPANSKLLVSNLTPLNGDPYGADSNAQLGNDDINLFNSLLLAEFGGPFNSDSYVAHASLSNVFLLDANSALTDPPNDLYSDNLHPNAQGYGKLADFYTDSFVSLGLTTVPEPTSAAVLAVIGGLAMCRRRRSA